MIIIDIVKDFSDDTGARYYSDGPDSGEEFYDKLLKTSFQKAIDLGEKLKVILDGTEGHASSFLNEAFGRLGKQFGADLVWKNLIIESFEVPKYIIKVKEAIYEERS
jgi:phosphomannomutase